MMSSRMIRSVLLRLSILASIALYYLVFSWTYDRFLYPMQYSWGFGARDIPLPLRFINWVMVLIPACWLPLRFERPSLFLFLLQYMAVFIPATIVLYESALPVLDQQQVTFILLSSFAGLSIWQATYSIKLVDLSRRPLTPGFFWALFVFLVTAALALNIGVLGANFQLADLKKIYAVRSSAAEISADSGLDGLVQHAQMWLSGFFLPFMFAAGAMYKKRWIYLVVGVVYLFLFGIAGAKSALLGLPVLLFMLFWVRGRPEGIYAKLSIGMSALLLVPYLLADEGVEKFIRLWYVNLVHSRIFGTPALIMGQYYTFFYDHPYTFWSHISGISEFVDNPYPNDIPRTIGAYFYKFDVGQNGGMWASDGLAALGLPGIIVISIFAACLMWVFDCVASRHDIRFVTICLGFIGISFTNISLATTLVSGGLLLLIAALYWLPPVRSTQSSLSTLSAGA